MNIITQYKDKPRSASIFQIREDICAALENVRVDEETGEITGQEEVNALAMSAEEKTVSICRFILRKDAFIDELEQHIKFCQEQLKREKRERETLANLAVFGLETANATKIKAPGIAIGTRKSESVEIFDESQLPKEYIKEKVTTAPDKTAIKIALKAGKEVPGAKIAENRNLSIKG